MRYRVALSVEAIQDFADLYDCLLPEAGSRIAENYIFELHAYCMSFETFPERGARRDDLALGVRIVGYRRKATIAFRIDGDLVTIVRIFHRGRNVSFSEEPEEG